MKTLVISFTIQKNVALAAGYIVASAKADEVAGKSEIILWDEETEDYESGLKSMEGLKKRILDFNPKILALSSYVWNLQQCLDIAELIKKDNKEIITILGGPGATFSSRFILENYSCLDYIVRGEGETTFIELLRHFMTGYPKLQEIKGLSWKKETIIETPNRAGVMKLDIFSSPFLAGVLEPKNDLLIETHRGCIFKCGYCLEARGYAGIREFSIDRVEKEVQWAISRDVKRITFVNSIFNINPERTEAMCNMLSKYKNSGIQFTVDSYAMLLNEKTADLYAHAGIAGTDIGLQTLNREALINIKRPWITKEKFKEKHELMKSRGIKTSVHLIIGLPGDNFKTFKNSFDYVYSIEPTNIAAFKLLLLPGTPLWMEREKFQLKYDDAPPFRVKSSMTFSEEEIRLAEIYAESKYKEFLMKNSYKKEKLLAIT